MEKCRATSRRLTLTLTLTLTPCRVAQAAAEKAALKLSAPTLANWFYELLQAPPSVKKADRFFELFHLDVLRVVGLGASHTAVNPALFEPEPEPEPEP